MLQEVWLLFIPTGVHHMNLKRLQTFIQVVEHQRFSEAAQILNLTQSGVSRQIKTLEDELGIQLLNRKTSLVELTPAGRLVYKKAKSLLAQWNELIQECHSFKKELSGILKIGSSTIPGTYLLPRIVKSFQDKYPKVEFSIMINDSSEIISMLENEQIDIAIVGSKPDPFRFKSHYIAEDRLVLVGNNRIPEITSIDEIKKFPFIVREKGSGTRNAMNQALQLHGIDPDELTYVAEVSSTESILAMIDEGVGVSFVSHWVINEMKRENIAVLYELPTDRCFYIASHSARQAHPLIHMFTQETGIIYGQQ